jgi:hypothetical protein
MASRWSSPACAISSTKIELNGRTAAAACRLFADALTCVGQLTVKPTVISAETLDFDELAVKPAVNLSKNA